MGVGVGSETRENVAGRGKGQELGQGYKNKVGGGVLFGNWWWGWIGVDHGDVVRVKGQGGLVGWGGGGGDEAMMM